ncbi:hypothetical protein [Geopseudomonas aromaticivorans]
MQLNKLFAATLLTSCLVGGPAAHAESAKIPAIAGKPYNQAREMLIAEGWKPAPSHSANEELFGQVRAFMAAGFNEIYDCAGAGAAPCIVYFRDSSTLTLKVVTVGESELKGEDFPIVDSFSLVSEVPSTDPEAAISPQAPTTQGWGNSTIDEWCKNVGNWYRLSGKARDGGISERDWRNQIAGLMAMVNNPPIEQHRYMQAGTTVAFQFRPPLSLDELQAMGENTCYQDELGKLERR